MINPAFKTTEKLILRVYYLLYRKIYILTNTLCSNWRMEKNDFFKKNPSFLTT